MSDFLDIHPASPDEVLAAHRNVFDFWGKGRTLEEHVDILLSSPSHRRATWYVGCVDETVVVSMGCYPFEFQMRGNVGSGGAIGSVFTIPEYRKRGYAARLLEWVDQTQKDAGVGMSVLYSDIDPNYYSKLGYEQCPSFRGWCNPQEIPAATANSALSLVPFDGAEELEEMAVLYAEYHGAAPVSIVRHEDYWQSLLQRFPNDRYYWLTEKGGGRAGYARLSGDSTKCRITDFALANQDDELAAELYTALIAEAKAQNIQCLGGWLPNTVAANDFFTMSDRNKEITMLKPLALAHGLDAESMASTDRFCEVDHV